MTRQNEKHRTRWARRGKIAEAVNIARELGLDVAGFQISPDGSVSVFESRRVWRGHIDLIEQRWGKFPIAIFADPRMTAKVVKWRNERAATPRSADIGITVLSALLAFARLRGHVPVNVARDKPQLYKGSDRAEIVWTNDDMAAFEWHAWEGAALT